MSAQDGKVPVMQCVGAAYRFALANWVSLLPACLAVGVAMALTPLLAGSGPRGLTMLLAMLVSALANAVLISAILRRALRPADAGLPQLGADEFRLLGVAMVIGLMFLPLGVLVGAVLMSLLAGQIASSPEALAVLMQDPDALQETLTQSLSPAGQMAFSAFILLIFAIGVWLGVRLFLVNAATVGEKRMVILQTWNWTRGNLARVAFAMFLALFPPMIVGGVITTLFMEFAGDLSQASLVTVAALSGVQAFIAAVTNIPLYALSAELYRGLRPPDFAPR